MEGRFNKLTTISEVETISPKMKHGAKGSYSQERLCLKKPNISTAAMIDVNKELSNPSSPRVDRRAPSDVRPTGGGAIDNTAVDSKGITVSAVAPASKQKTRKSGFSPTTATTPTTTTPASTTRSKSLSRKQPKNFAGTFVAPKAAKRTTALTGTAPVSLINARITLGLAREFNVTHISDNWKLRKAEKLAAMERTNSSDIAAIAAISRANDASADTRMKSGRKSIVPPSTRSEHIAITVTPPSKRGSISNGVPPVSPLTKRGSINIRSPTKNITGTPPTKRGSISNGVPARNRSQSLDFTISLPKPRKGSLDIEGRQSLLSMKPRGSRRKSSVGVVLHRMKHREKTILSVIKENETKSDKLVSQSPLNEDDIFHDDESLLSETLDDNFDDEELEAFKDEVCAAIEKDDETTDISEVEVAPARKELGSEDFDTDLSEPDSDSEVSSPRKKAKAQNRTLRVYMTACSRCSLTPNPTFMRQCGQGFIDMRNRMLTYKDAKPIAIALVDDMTTVVLDLSDNPLGPLGTSYIAEMIYANSNIIDLNLSNTDPGAEGLSSLAQTLLKNKDLRRLQLDSNVIQEGDGRYLARIVMRAPGLRELTLNHTTLGFKDATRMAIALASDQCILDTLSLRYNNIRTDAAIQLALAIGRNTSLRSLNLAWNGVGIEGCRALAKSLAQNTTLRELDLTNNRLGIKCLEHLVNGLKMNAGLSSVKLGTNPMTTEGAKAIVAAITEAKDSSVEEIDLRGIPIDSEFVKLVEKLRETKAVWVLHDNTISMGTTDMTKKFDGTNLDRFDPVMVLFEYMKKDNLRVIDLFQFFDQKKRDKLSRTDLRTGVNTLRLPFTEHSLDIIMKGLDGNKDGFLTLEDMVKGYKENDRIVKQRRIRANRRKKPDRGLEDLWTILKEIIDKRKADNEKKTQAAAAGGSGGLAENKNKDGKP